MVVMDSGDKCRDDLAVAGVYHTVGKLAEVLHEAMQCLFWDAKTMPTGR
jgi:hypothetical protein